MISKVHTAHSKVQDKDLFLCHDEIIIVIGMICGIFVRMFFALVIVTVIGDLVHSWCRFDRKMAPNAEGLAIFQRKSMVVMAVLIFELLQLLNALIK